MVRSPREGNRDVDRHEFWKSPEEIGSKLDGRLYAPIAAELAEAETVFAAELGQPPVPLRPEPRRPLRRFPGQAAPTGARPPDRQGLRRGHGPDHAVLAAVVEMIHTATLVHDDILDESIRSAATPRR